MKTDEELNAIVYDAFNAAVQSIQTDLGESTGDFAGAYFSDADKSGMSDIEKHLKAYALEQEQYLKEDKDAGPHM
jgi:hypothetical protein